MSGGHWDYFGRKLQDAAEEPDHARESLTLLAQIEHELDWGYSCDTCIRCARRRVLAALDQFYEDRALSIGATAILRDREQVTTWCSPCLQGLIDHPPINTRIALPSPVTASRELARRSRDDTELT